MFKIAPNLTLPEDAVTQTFAFLAKRGMGKTYAAGVFVEEMAEHGAQIVVIDPTDVWWGLKSSANGKKTGYPFIIFGGNHADVSLTEDAGKVLADFVVESGHSVIISTRLLSKTKQRRFIADFFERLYHRKGEKGQQHPLHVMVDEADCFVPQTYKGDLARCVGAIDDVVRRGRSSGLGVSLVSQRSAKVNKDVLSQAEVLVAMQTGGPHDRKALREWVEANADIDVLDEFFSNLARLQVGEAFVWSPSWLQILQKIKFRKKRTYDSSRTPKVGERLSAPKTVAQVDLESLKSQMAESIERGKQNDPKLLKQQIAELKRQISKSSPIADTAAIERTVARVEAERDRHWKAEIAKLQKSSKTLVGRLDKIHSLSTLNGERTASIETHPQRVPVQKPPQLERTARIPRPSTREIDGDVRIGGGCLRMVQVLADRHPANFTESQWATMARLKKSGGTWSTYKSRLLTAGLIEQQGGLWVATDLAVEEYSDPSRAPQTMDELISSWKQKLGGGSARMIDELVEVYPDSISKQDLAARVGITYGAGTFGTYLSRLRSNGLVEDEGGELRAAMALVEL